MEALHVFITVLLLLCCCAAVFTLNVITVFDNSFVFIVRRYILFVTLLRKCTKFVACRHQWGSQRERQLGRQEGGGLVGYPSTDRIHEILVKDTLATDILVTGHFGNIFW